MSEWFTGSKKGLEKIARRRGLSYVLFELVQNCWDTGAKNVTVKFEPVEGAPLCKIIVEDDNPEGFKDLTHAWTLFAESEKKSDPEKRGRFNLGEKLVLAICESAEIVSTKGNVRFDKDGRHVGRQRLEKGSIFLGHVKMTRSELKDILDAARRLIAPPGIKTTVNGTPVVSRPPVATFETSLMTEVANEEGVLVPRVRKTVVRVYDAFETKYPNDQPDGWLYEMGIPVCPTGDKWDIEIMQKIPVNLERNNVSAAYLRTVRVAVLNQMFPTIRPEDTTSTAVQEALQDTRILPEAVQTVITQQFGEKRAIFDPSDREANNRLVAEGYKIIHGNMFSKEAWDNIRESGAALPSGQIRPTPKPYSNDPDAPNRVLLPESDWSNGMRNIASYAKEIARRTISRNTLRVTIDKGHKGAGWEACYGNGELTFNLATLGAEFFEHGPNLRVNVLLIHEFSHNHESNHLSDGFADAGHDIGARLTELALTEPELFKKHGWRAS
jgi:hypothetical protein